MKLNNVLYSHADYAVEPDGRFHYFIELGLSQITS